MRNNAQSINTQLTGFIQATLHNWGVEQITKRERENTVVYAGGFRLMPRCGSSKLDSVFIENGILNSTKDTMYAVGLMGKFDPDSIMLVPAERMREATNDETVSWAEPARIGFSKEHGWGFCHSKLREIGGKSLTEMFNV